MRVRKSVIVLCLFLLISIVLPAAVHAADTTYSLDELGMDITLPNDYIVFTREIRDDDPNLAAYGLTKEGLSSLMLSDHIYLDAWDENVNREIFIRMTNTPFVDFSQYDDAMLLSFASTLGSEYENNGITYIKSEVYEHEQRKFIKIYTKQPYENRTTYGLQYGSIQGGKAIFITLYSFVGSIGTDEEVLLKTIVDGTKFAFEPQVTPPATNEVKSPFEYTDAETQTSFTVGGNWTEEELFQDRAYIDVKFVSNLGDGTIILYGSIDLWKEMSASEKEGSLRSDINSSIFSKADVAQILAVDASNIEEIMLGGYDYYRVENTTVYSDFGFEITLPMTQMLRIDNGYMHVYQYSGENTDPRYQDFEQLVASARYPAASSNVDNEIVATQDNVMTQNSINTADQPINPYRFTAADWLFSFFLTITIYSLPIIIYRYAIRKTPVRPRTARRITILYAIFAFITMALVISLLEGSKAPGGAIALWSFINYRMLTAGYYKEDGAETPTISAQVSAPPYEKAEGSVAETIGARPSPETRLCRQCGNKLLPESLYCNICGTEIE